LPYSAGRKNGAGAEGIRMIEWESKPEEEEQDQEGKELTLIDLDSFYDLLMEQQEQM